MRVLILVALVALSASYVSGQSATVNINFANLFNGLNLNGGSNNGTNGGGGGDNNGTMSTCNQTLIDYGERYATILTIDSIRANLDAHFYKADGNPYSPSELDWDTMIYNVVTEPPEYWQGEQIATYGWPSGFVNFSEGGYQKYYTDLVWNMTAIEGVAATNTFNFFQWAIGGDLEVLVVWQSVFQVPGRPDTAQNVSEYYYGRFDPVSHLQNFAGHWAHDAGYLALAQALGYYPGDMSDCYLC